MMERSRRPEITPLVSGNEVTFYLRAPTATMANCLGTFNDWDLTSGVMKRDSDGDWILRTEVPLEGSYDYKFLVDGRWIADPLNPDYGPDGKGYINSRFQVGTSSAGRRRLDEASSILDGASPEVAAEGGISAERRRAFGLLDGVFRLPAASRAVAVKDHLAGRLAAAARRDARDGLTCIYNHGFIMSRAGSSLAMDLVSTRQVWGLYWDLPDALIASLAGMADILVVSHLHPDHFDIRIAGKVLERGGTVAAPEEITGRMPAGVTGIPPGRETELGPWRVTLHRGAHVYDSERRQVVRAIEAVAPDGFRLLHTSDLDYTSSVPPVFSPDLLIPKAGGISPLVADDAALGNLILHMEPKFVVPGHLNELGHPVRGGRYPYSTAMKILAGTNSRWNILHWGERIRI